MTARQRRLVNIGRMRAQIEWKGRLCIGTITTPDHGRNYRIVLRWGRNEEAITIEGRCRRAVAIDWANYIVREGLCDVSGRIAGAGAT